MKFLAKPSNLYVYFVTLFWRVGSNSERKFHENTNGTTLKLSLFVFSKIKASKKKDPAAHAEIFDFLRFQSCCLQRIFSFSRV